MRARRVLHSTVWVTLLVKGVFVTAEGGARGGRGGGGGGSGGWGGCEWGGGGGVSPVVVQPVAVRSAAIVRPAQAIILAVARPAVGAGRAALGKGSRVDKAPPVSGNPNNRGEMLPVRP